MALKFSIKRGKNMVVDVLSTKYEDVEALLCYLYIIKPDWIVEAREEWKNDLSVWMLIQKLENNTSVSDTFVCKNDYLW